MCNGIGVHAVFQELLLHAMGLRSHARNGSDGKTLKRRAGSHRAQVVHAVAGPVVHTVLAVIRVLDVRRWAAADSERR